MIEQGGETMFFRRAKANLNDNEPVAERAPAAPSLISRDVTIEGELSSEGDVHIEGTVRGTIRARRCLIEADGEVEGRIIADEIVVRGRAVGPLRAYHVHLEAGSRVDGDVVNCTIAIDSGAELTGSVWRSDDPFAEPVEAPPRPVPQAPREPPSYLQSPLWNGSDSQRPLLAVRPRSS